MTSPVDPFTFKRRSKLNPSRLSFTAKARLAKKLSLRNFEQYHIPLRLQVVQTYATEDTAVTPSQMQVLVQAVEETEHLDASMVEIGVYRGVTTAILAAQTKRNYEGWPPTSAMGRRGRL